MATRDDARKKPGERGQLRRTGAGYSVVRPGDQSALQLRSLSAEASEADDELQAQINELAAYISGEGLVSKVKGAVLIGVTDAAAIHDNTATEIASITEKVSPVSGDLLVIEDSAASNVKKRVQVGNLPSSGGGSTDQLLHLGW